MSRMCVEFPRMESLQITKRKPHAKPSLPPMPRLTRPRREVREKEAGGHGKKADNEGVRPSRRFRRWPFAAMSVDDVEPGGRPKWQQPFWVLISPTGHPSKRRLMTVQDFFRYTEEEGRKFFDELDEDRDGRVSLGDMKEAMRKRKLPESYAYEFLKRARGGRWWAKSIGWDDFKMVVDERESEVLKAFTTLKVNSRGRLELSGIQDSLELLGLPATEENAKAMLRALDSDQDGFVSYGKFRSFALLLPKHKLQQTLEPSAAWFESATMLPLGPVPESTEDTGRMLATAALAGALASGLSTFILHPLDTLKTRVQSTVGVSILDMMKSVPKIGSVGLYRGVLPATTGAGLSHGLRTCAYEGSLKVLMAVTGGAGELQMQGLASGVGTLLGTAFRIPCEVLKQRLQAGQHNSVQEALSTALEVEGTKSLFRGTTATLAREVPFYMCGIVFYQILKKAFRGELLGKEGRELMPWETLMVGAMSGALGAIVTTPADVMKTRIMTAPVGTKVSASQILIDIIKVEGLPALFKGALPRAIWIAPLGAMNFAGYELAKNALSNRGMDIEESTQQPDVKQETDEETHEDKKPFWQRARASKRQPQLAKVNGSETETAELLDSMDCESSTTLLSEAAVTSTSGTETSHDIGDRSPEAGTEVGSLYSTSILDETPGESAEIPAFEENETLPPLEVKTPDSVDDGSVTTQYLNSENNSKSKSDVDDATDSKANESQEATVAGVVDSSQDDRPNR